jgi:hypothetical protein
LGSLPERVEQDVALDADPRAQLHSTSRAIAHAALGGCLRGHRGHRRHSVSAAGPQQCDDKTEQCDDKTPRARE